MKSNNILKYTTGIALMALLSVSSCTSYLEKDPDSSVSQNDAFKNFYNFQGFVEEIYNCIPDKTKCYYTTTFNWGDDEVMNPNADFHQGPQFDLGNFWAWQGGMTSEPSSWLDKSDTNPASGDRFKHALWSHAWYCIRKANMGMENIDLMTNASEEERNLILGQLYFFRAWWHFEISQFFGGMPYVTEVLDVVDTPMMPRLDYQEYLELVAADFRKAADLLPCDWDTTTVGANTYGYNSMRVDKIAALGYLGKSYLWAASPLMENGAQIGGTKTYAYNKDYAKKALEAFGELLTYVESGEANCKLTVFDYDSIEDLYNHNSTTTLGNSYSDNFYTFNNNFATPGEVEGIFRGPSYDGNKSVWAAARTYGPKINGLIKSDNVIHQPTANYVNLYGMKNGLPLKDGDSGFSKEYPFRDRDPRFYHDIVFDGFKYVNEPIKVESDKFLKYCTLYTGGAMRDVQQASKTGYFTQKLSPHQVNIYDQYDEKFEYGLHLNLSYMRLADIYLMYAEAGAAVDGAETKSTTFPSLSAVGAINVIRTRVGVADVDARYAADPNKFMDEVRRERAVELSFEGFRFNDLQRWLLLTEPKYTTKTSQEFTRAESDSYFTDGNDPAEARVIGFREETILVRPFNARHYWFPLKKKDVSMSPDFNQNPGW